MPAILTLNTDNRSQIAGSDVWGTGILSRCAQNYVEAHYNSTDAMVVCNACGSKDHCEEL